MPGYSAAAICAFCSLPVETAHSEKFEESWPGTGGVESEKDQVSVVST